MTEHDAFERRFHAAMRGYAGQVSSDLDPIEFAHRIVATEPRRAGFAAALEGRWNAIPRYVWILVLLAALLAATIATMAIVGFPPAPRWPVLRDVGLTPTGVDVLTAEPASYTRMVADGEGVLWARDTGGRLVRHDPARASGRSWTVSDDAAFTSSEIAPAHAGGAWLVTGRTVRRFDGTAFRQVIDAPADITVLTEAPDRTLWAGTSDGSVLHWDGSTWITLDPGRPSSTAEITAIQVDRAGRTWVGWRHPEMLPARGWVSRYDGSRWTRLDGSDAAPLGGAVTSIAEAADGAVWIASETGLARLHGTSWTDETPETRGALITSMSADRDGAIWVAGFLVDGPTTVGHFDAVAWAWYGASDGLPVAGGYVGGIEATEQGVFVATADGIVRRSSGTWESVWPPAPAGPTEVGILLAISHDELWATGDRGLWHYLEGSWTYEEVTADPSAAPTVLTQAPDGTLWASGSDGVAYRRDGRWLVADTAPASAIAIDTRGTAWVAGTDTWRTMRLGKGPELWTLRFDGSSWVRRTVDGCPLQSLGQPVRSMVFDATGALWAGIPLGMEPGGLARFDGYGWATIATIAGSDIGGATVLGTDPGGGMWVEVQYPYVRADGVHVQTVWAARFDEGSRTLIDVPAGDGVHALLASRGMLWASTPRGPARYDGTAWTFPYAGIALTAWTGGALGWQAAPDGTVFGYAGSSVLRFPATR